MEDVATFYVHLVYFTAIWYTYLVAFWHLLWMFCIFFPVLVCCTKINLATVIQTPTPTWLGPFSKAGLIECTFLISFVGQINFWRRQRKSD
jgi:hypothetical protein